MQALQGNIGGFIKHQIAINIESYFGRKIATKAIAWESFNQNRGLHFSYYNEIGSTLNHDVVEILLDGVQFPLHQFHQSSVERPESPMEVDDNPRNRLLDLVVARAPPPTIREQYIHVLEVSNRFVSLCRDLYRIRSIFGDIQDTIEELYNRASQHPATPKIIGDDERSLLREVLNCIVTHRNRNESMSFIILRISSILDA